MDSKVNYVIQRIEKKYLMSESQYHYFLEQSKDHLQRDQYGLHTICSLYYDTPQFDLARHSIEKPKYKEKLRVRSYGIPTSEDTVFVELKKKVKGIGNKRRIAMRRWEAEGYFHEGIVPARMADQQIMKEINYFVSFYKPVPGIFVFYDREAFFDKNNPEVRLTIDRKIRSRDYDFSLGSGDYGQLLLNDDMYLMEIKVPAAMPSWMVHIVSEMELYPISFSKYGNIYKHLIYEGQLHVPDESQVDFSPAI